MASTPSPPPAGTPGKPSELASDDQPGERCGPVAIERQGKEDGRVLILYTRIQESSSA